MQTIELMQSAVDVMGRQVAAAVAVPTAATPCEAWNVSQLVGHVVGACQGNAAMFGGPDNDVDPFDPPAIAAADMVSRYETAATRLLDSLKAPGALERVIEHPAMPEPAPIAQAAMFPMFDLYIHSWDFSQATGLAAEDPDELHAAVDAMCRGAFAGERTPGIVGPAVPAPANATRLQDLAAFLGRAS